VLGYATADKRNPCGVFTALEDMSRAVHLICEMDSESPLFLLGFSAGGHLARCLPMSGNRKKRRAAKTSDPQAQFSAIRL